MSSLARSSWRAGALPAHLGMVLWALLVGLSFPAVGLLSQGLPPLALTSLRFVIAAAAVLPLVWRAPGLCPSRPGLLLYGLMGLCLAGFFGAMFWVAHLTSALSMATLFVSVPLLAYCLGRLVGVEDPALSLLGLLLLGAAGAIALAWAEAGGSFANMRLGTGELVFFLGCIASALYPVLSKLGLARGWLSPHAGVRTLWSLVLGALLIGMLGVAAGDSTALLQMTSRDLGILVYLGLFSSGMTFWLQQYATATLTPAGVTAYGYLVPFVSMLLLFVQMPTRISWLWLPGSVLVVAAIVLLLRRDMRQRRHAVPRTDAEPECRMG